MSVTLVCCLCAATLLAAALLSSPMQVQAAPVVSNPQASQLFEDAGAQAAALNLRADKLQGYTLDDEVSWQIHADQLNQMRDDINTLADTLDKLKNMRNSMVPWQQQALARIVPLEAKVASDTSKTIAYLNQHRTRIIDQPYQKDVHSSADAAQELSAMVNDYLAYARDKTNMETVQRRLASLS